jgi:hypothetical protein
LWGIDGGITCTGEGVRELAIVVVPGELLEVLGLGVGVDVTPIVLGDAMVLVLAMTVVALGFVAVVTPTRTWWSRLCQNNRV